MIPAFIIGAELFLFAERLLWLGVLGLSFVLVLVLHTFMRTFYAVTSDNFLVIKCGFIYNYKIEIDKIYSIRRSVSFASSPALSFDRITVYYFGGNHREYVLISPKDRDTFIALLKERNSSINVAI